MNRYVDEDVWRNFRIACIKRGKSASQEVVRLMREQRERWQQDQLDYRT